MQIGILSGIYSDKAANLRIGYPRNMVPVPVESGISAGYLRPSDGIVPFGEGPGADRGGFNWEGVCYRVMGSKFGRVGVDGAFEELGDVGAGSTVTMDNGFDRLAIAASGNLFYWDGSTLSRVADTDLGYALDMRWMAGYYVTTDGTYVVVTELNDPMTVNPLKYGSAESDPDKIWAVDELRNELYVFGRYTIEVFENVGGDNFPFQRIEGAQVVRGVMGTHTYTQFSQTFAFLGSGKNEAPAVYLMGPGATEKISSAEIDRILATYTEAELSASVMEARLDNGQNKLLLHLKDRTLVFDGSATEAFKSLVWYTLDSGILAPSTYRAQNLVWCYDKWIAGDVTSNKLGTFSEETSEHYDQVIGWDFGTAVIYNASRGAIIHELELAALPGRVTFGKDPVVWTSYSLDGETWSQERPTAAGKTGQRNKRIAWRKQGAMRNYRMQKFRGTSDAHVSFARLEAQIEALNA